MIPTNKLSVCHPDQCKPGTLLIRNARYERNLQLVCGDSTPSHILRLPSEKPFLFDLSLMAKNLGQHVAIDDFLVLCDPDVIFSPNRSEIPFGAICILDGKTCIAAKSNYSTVYIGIDGSIMEESFDNFVAFAKWKIVTRTFDDAYETLYEYEATVHS